MSVVWALMMKKRRNNNKKKLYIEEKITRLFVLFVSRIVDAQDKKTLKMNARSMVSVKPRFWVDFYF